MDEKLLQMAALLHEENIYIISLLSGIYPPEFIEKNIKPQIKQMNEYYDMIIGRNSKETNKYTS